METLERGRIYIEKKFIIKIDIKVNKDILKSYKEWIQKYENYINISFKNEKYDFYIGENDLKYFTKLKKTFKKWIKNNLILEKNKVYFLEDEKIIEKYQVNKIRPYFIKNPSTKANKKIVLYPLSTQRRKNLKQYKFEQKISYLNHEEPETKNKYKFIKACVDKKPIIKKIKQP